jgi:ubiquinone/menaquinone biosynthesis C-methylase UbiE
MKVILPEETDYPMEIFRTDLPPELRVGCARAYFKQNVIARRIFRKRIEVAFDLMPNRHWKYALDAGTGAGFFLPTLSLLTHTVIGIDMSPVLRFTREMLDKRSIHNVHLYIADLLHLPFSSDTFDLIVCLSVIEHIPDPTAAFTEMGRVLKNDGVLIVGFPLEHALYHFCKSLCSTYNCLRLRGKPKKVSADKWFHPRVSDYHQIEHSWDSTFRLVHSRNIGIASIPLYRMFRLVKKS